MVNKKSVLKLKIKKFVMLQFLKQTKPSETYKQPPEPIATNQHTSTEAESTEKKGFLRDFGRYIIIVRRGGTITDVWKLESADIRYNDTAKGWVVYSKNCPTFFVSGDVEIWNIDEQHNNLWAQYQPFHQLNTVKEVNNVQNLDPETAVKKSFFRWPVRWEWNSPIKWNW